MKIYEKLYNSYKQIIENKPIILNLSNYVTQDFIANILLALGSSPIMSEDQSEFAELINIAHSVNINIGTLNPEFGLRAYEGASLAKKMNKPVILDPVGAGATSSRTLLSLQLAEYANIIRGNSSEIIALGGKEFLTAGVDSVHDSFCGKDCAQLLANKYQNIIVISGKTDLIISDANNFSNNFGHVLMTKVTGIGCALNSVIAAFAAVNKNYALASYLAVAFYTLCAEQALRESNKPSGFKTKFIDAVYEPDWCFIENKLSGIYYE